MGFSIIPAAQISSGRSICVICREGAGFGQSDRLRDLLAKHYGPLQLIRLSASGDWPSGAEIQDTLSLVKVAVLLLDPHLFDPNCPHGVGASSPDQVAEYRLLETLTESGVPVIPLVLLAEHQGVDPCTPQGAWGTVSQRATLAGSYDALPIAIGADGDSGLARLHQLIEHHAGNALGGHFLRILLIEPEELRRLAFRRIAMRDRHYLRMAAPDEAPALLAKDRFDLILMPARMQEPDSLAYADSALITTPSIRRHALRSRGFQPRVCQARMA